MGICLLNNGEIAVFPSKCLYLSSFRLNITIPHVHINSCLVVAITISSFVSLTFHFTSLKVDGISLYSISESEIVVLNFGSQLFILLSSYIKFFLYKSIKVDWVNDLYSGASVKYIEPR